MASSSRAQTPAKRLMNELTALHDEPNEACARLGPVADGELLHWEAVLRGVPGSAYEGISPCLCLLCKRERKRADGGKDGLWLLDIKIPPNYPLSPPTIAFVTPICHPNVHFKTGEICLDLLKTAWVPTYTVSTTLTSIHQLLTSPEPDSPLNVDIALMFRQGDVVGAESLVRFYTSTIRYEERRK
jgi:peroxin-4